MSVEGSPLNPILPLVGEAVKDVVGGEMREHATSGRDIIRETHDRLLVEQPHLMRQINSYISNAARDDRERLRMIESAMLTYKMLETQAEAEAVGWLLPDPEMPEL